MSAGRYIGRAPLIVSRMSLGDNQNKVLPIVLNTTYSESRNVCFIAKERHDKWKQCALKSSQNIKRLISSGWNQRLKLKKLSGLHCDFEWNLSTLTAQNLQTGPELWQLELIHSDSKSGEKICAKLCSVFHNLDKKISTIHRNENSNRTSLFWVTS